jgi:hypothetical protein
VSFLVFAIEAVLRHVFYMELTRGSGRYGQAALLL